MIESSRHLGVARVIHTAVQIKQRHWGLRPSQVVASLVAHWLSGGELCQDLTTPIEGQALATLLGSPPAGSDQAA